MCGLEPVCEKLTCDNKVWREGRTYEPSDWREEERKATAAVFPYDAALFISNMLSISGKANKIAGKKMDCGVMP